MAKNNDYCGPRVGKQALGMPKDRYLMGALFYLEGTIWYAELCDEKDFTYKGAGPDVITAFTSAVAQREARNRRMLA